MAANDDFNRPNPARSGKAVWPLRGPALKSCDGSADAARYPLNQDGSSILSIARGASSGARRSAGAE